MVWLFVPELADLNSDSQSPCPNTELWVTLSGTPSQRPSSWRGWQTRAWIRLLSGTALQPSTAARGVESWISSLAVSPVSRGAPQDDRQAPATSGGSGLTSHELFVKWNRDSSSWKTSQGYLLAGLDTFSETWPKCGSMRSGACYRRPSVVLRTDDGGCSSWPTPNVPNRGVETKQSKGARPEAGGIDLQTTAMQWGTPRVTTNAGIGHATDDPKSRLEDQAANLWATPAARDNKSGQASQETLNKNARPLNEQATMLWSTPGKADADGEHLTRSGDRSNEILLPGQAKAFQCGPPAPTTPTDGQELLPQTRRLNPRFVEWLMGWPHGWTDFAPVAMESYLSRQRWLLSYLLNE